MAKLAAHNFDQTSARLRKNILEFYAGPSLPVDAGIDPAHQQAIQTNLSLLKSAALLPIAADKPSLAKP
jgi:hypothetical protein